MPKYASVPVEIMTADEMIYDPNETYHFFDAQTQQIRQSLGLRRSGEYLCTFGLRVVPISKLRNNRSDALADGQSFFKSEIENLENRIKYFETEKNSTK